MGEQLVTKQISSRYVLLRFTIVDFLKIAIFLWFFYIAVYKNYFVLIRKQDIKSGSNRTLDYLRNKVFEKLEKYYL